jgi:hypothetical protein
MDLLGEPRIQEVTMKPTAKIYDPESPGLVGRKWRKHPSLRNLRTDDPQHILGAYGE